jgi:Domain of unknown function (DUF4956)
MAEQSSIERLATRLGIESGGRQIGRTTIVRLTGYYIIVLLVIAGFIVLTGGMHEMAQDRATDSTVEQAVLEPLFRSLPPLVTGAAAVTGAFLLALPVAFVYVRTRNRIKYDQSLVQTVIMLPVVITAILIVVQNSLALAFSLAGIVAAVRFRNNLKDSRDAVYIFAAVGVGFAAGVGQLAIAAFLSLFFCLLELLLWKLDLTADHERTFGMLCLPATAGPAEFSRLGLDMPANSAPNLPSADTHLLALGGAEPSPNGDKAKRPVERLRLYVTDTEEARPRVEKVLEGTAKGYKFKRARARGNDQYVLEYAVRPRKKISTENLLDRLYQECGSCVIAAELVDPEK